MPFMLSSNRFLDSSKKFFRDVSISVQVSLKKGSSKKDSLIVIGIRDFLSFVSCLFADDALCSTFILLSSLISWIFFSLGTVMTMTPSCERLDTTSACLAPAGRLYFLENCLDTIM